jgi:hypothetical protein
VCRISDEGPFRVRAEGLTARSRAERDCSLHVPVSADLAPRRSVSVLGWAGGARSGQPVCVGQALSRPWDLRAIVAGTITAAVAIGYLLLMRAEGDTPTPWFLSGLVIAVILLAYSANRGAGRRRPALALVGVDLLGLGIVGLASIGFPLVCAGVLALISAGRE